MGLTFEEKDGEIRTVGLGEIGQTEFMTKVSALTDAEEARKILFQVAAYVVSNGTRLRPGDALTCDNKVLELRTAGNYLEVIEAPEPRCGGQEFHLGDSRVRVGAENDE